MPDTGVSGQMRVLSPIYPQLVRAILCRRVVWPAVFSDLQQITLHPNYHQLSAVN